MRLIDADEFFKNYPELAIEPYINAPTVAINCKDCDGYEAGYSAGVNDAQRPQGKWIFRQGVTAGGYYKCNKCGEVERAEKNFCSNCGADMKGGAEE